MPVWTNSLKQITDNIMKEEDNTENECIFHFLGHINDVAVLIGGSVSMLGVQRYVVGKLPFRCA